VYWSVEPFTTVLYTGMTAIGFPELSSVPIDDVVALAEPEVPLFIVHTLSSAYSYGTTGCR
jgi:hypothetical protein